MLVGTGGAEGEFVVGPLLGKAGVYALGEGWFALCGGRLLRGKATMFESDAPVSIAFDLEAGTVTVPEPVAVTLCGRKQTFSAGKHDLTPVGEGALGLDHIRGLPDWQDAVRVGVREGIRAGLCVRYGRAGSGLLCGV